MQKTSHALTREALERAARTGTLPSAHAPDDPSCDVAIEDWDTLLIAVKDRLTAVVSGHGDQSCTTLSSGMSCVVQASVRECVSALDQLHLTYTHEQARRQHLERELLSAQMQLAHTLAELAGTQAGEQRARHQALHDDLTNLPNGIGFRARLNRRLSGADLPRPPLAVLYLDLDGFKHINDTHGHHIGDELLRIVALRLTRAVRAEDVVSRLSGDEFACMLAEMPSREQLATLAHKLGESVSAPLKVGQLRLTVAVSIGIAMCPKDGVSTVQLLQHADRAMHHAKRQGSGYAFFDQCTGG